MKEWEKVGQDQNSSWFSCELCGKMFKKDVTGVIPFSNICGDCDAKRKANVKSGDQSSSTVS